MKKLLLLLFIIIYCVPFTVNAVENNQVEELQEKLNALWLENDGYSAQIIQTMHNQYNAYVETQVHTAMLAPEYARAQIGLTGSEEEQREQVRQSLALSWNQGIKVYPIITRSYLNQYMQNNLLSYLFDENYYWVVINERGTSCGKFDMDGNHIGGIMMPNEEKILYSSRVISQDSISLLKDINDIEEQLIAYGEKNVDDVRVIAMESNLTFLYIRCNDNEYLARIYDDMPDRIAAPYILYKIEDMINKIVEYQKENPGYPFSDLAIKIKPTYEAEAQALQQQGILFGNENGLDLLKPMTRIEAAAMVLRVLDVPQKSPDESVQVFSDVPQTHWGYASASQAYDIGLIAGVGDGEFAPDRTVTGTEFASILLRAAGTSDFDWKEALNILVEQNVITREQADKMDLFTRGDMAKIIYEAQEVGMF